MNSVRSWGFRNMAFRSSSCNVRRLMVGWSKGMCGELSYRKYKFNESQ